jgi:DNA mismatch repair protein MutL
MTRIHLLSEELINQIAAGEVVERPASVVKELVENSIDAGATRIEIEVKEGGRKLIRVLDNGCGMSREEAHLAFQRHATSKISRLEDLYQISSLGFRGEALPSIASVAKVELLTKSQENSVGTLLKIEAGQLKFVKEHPANQGTRAEVSDLFYSTPARRKFLKSQMTETRHIIDLATNFALAFPQIAFRLTVDGREVLKLESADLKQRIAELFGQDVIKKIIELRETGIVGILGFVGKPELSKSSRSDIRFFVNQRSINNRALLHALTSAYGDMLTKGRFPLAVIFLEVPAHLVDVNVHPQKLEVRFQDERGVHDLVYRAVKKALDREFVGTVQKSVESSVSYSINQPSSLVREPPSEYQYGPVSQESVLRELFSEPVSGRAAPFQPKKELPLLESNFYQLFNTYILTQSGGELLIIDQHAAHERVLYEEILHGISSQNKAISQKLLFPETIDLTPKEFAEFQNNSEVLEKLGFEIQSLGGKTVMLSAVPALARNQTTNFLKVVLDESIHQSEAGKERSKTIASALACHAAVKAGDPLTVTEMQSLLKSLLVLDTPQVCPHGRPTLIRIPRSELERRFGRS